MNAPASTSAVAAAPAETASETASAATVSTTDTATGPVSLIDAMTPDVLIETGGRLHPVLLHLPIGLLALLALLEFGRLLRRRKERPDHGGAAVWLTAVVGAAAAGSGWLLGDSGAYGGDTLTLHRWLGVAVGWGCVTLAIAWSCRWMRVYRAVLIITLLALLPAGHLGGEMTHGPGFLTEPIRTAMAGRPAPVVSEVATVAGNAGADANAGAAASPGATFAADVLPILDARCGSCHGDRRQRGGLALLSSEAILAGGDSGSVLEAVDGREAELLHRILLPLEDDLHMPPVGRQQPTEAEVGILTAWLAAGAPFEAAFEGADDVAGDVVSGDDEASLAAGDAEADPAADPAILTESDPIAEAVPVIAGPAAADPAAIAAIRERFATVAEIVPGEPGLTVDLSVAPGRFEPHEITELLAPVAESVVELSLSRQRVPGRLVPLLVSMSHLESLDLRGAEAGDRLLEPLAAMPRLQELNLVGTDVTDEGIAALASAAPASLERIHLWDTAVSPDGIASLIAARPELLVVGDAFADVEPIETEPEIEFSSDRPVPGAAADSADAPVSLAAINDTCPVNGTPVDGTYRIVHDGMIVAFCCENCAARFWADPDAFTVVPAAGDRR